MGAPPVGALAPGSRGTIVAGPASADGSTWWEVSYKGGLASWAVQEDLMQASAQASQASPTVTPSAAPTLAIGMRIKAIDPVYMHSAPSPNAAFIGDQTPGSEGVVIGGPVSAGTATLWKVAFSDDFTGWTLSAGLKETQRGAPYVQFGVGASLPGVQKGYVPTGGSAQLSWSATNNPTSCTGSGGGPQGAAFSTGGNTSGTTSPLNPSYSVTYTVTCTNASGSNSASASVIVNSAPTSHTWAGTGIPSGTFGQPGVQSFDSGNATGALETRGLFFIDGSLYAGLGDAGDTSGNKGVYWGDGKTIPAQILRLNSLNGSWVPDQNFLTAVSHGSNNYWDFGIIASLNDVRLTSDYHGTTLSPAEDVLLAGTWGNKGGYGLGGVWNIQKTLAANSAGGPQGTWSIVQLATTPSVETRAFASHTDAGTGIQMVFGGADAAGIFSGAFNQRLGTSPGTVGWGPNFNNTQIAPERGSVQAVANATYAGWDFSGRVMAAVDCAGTLYMAVFDTILMRQDSNSPGGVNWVVYAKADHTNWAKGVSGFRGLSCVASPNSSTKELWTALENGDLYTIPLGQKAPYSITASNIELHLSKYLSTQMGTWVSSGTAAYNRTVVYPYTGNSPHQDIIFGVGAMMANVSSTLCPSWADPHPGAQYAACQHPAWMVRHPNGVYDFGVIEPFAQPWELAARDVVIGKFSSDGIGGRIFSGGYDAHGRSSQNTAWVYKASR